MSEWALCAESDLDVLRCNMENLVPGIWLHMSVGSGKLINRE
jgi:hypothetical protein